MKFNLKSLVITAALALMSSPVAGQAVLWGVDPFDDNLYSINQSTGAFLVTRTVTMPGFTVIGTNGLALDPTSGYVYAIVRVTGGARRLATIDLNTGVASNIGLLGDNFASIAFTTAGVLYGVTGDGATVPETLYTINKTTAASTFVLTLGNGADGEVIAFNPVNGLMYHWSGIGGGTIFESINLGTLAVTNIPQSGAAHSEVFGAVWNGTTFFITDITSTLFTQTIAGAVTSIGAAAADYRGLAFVFPVTNNSGIPTLGEWGMILLAGMLVLAGAYRLRHRTLAA